jgi:hypothetical protein
MRKYVTLYLNIEPPATIDDEGNKSWPLLAADPVKVRNSDDSGDHWQILVTKELYDQYVDQEKPTLKYKEVPSKYKIFINSHDVPIHTFGGRIHDPDIEAELEAEEPNGDL